jgi:hypothetical protein
MGPFDRNDRRSSSNDFEFEVTTFDDARAALEAPPPGVRNTVFGDAGDSTFRRKPHTPRDRVLSSVAWAWLEGLPSEVRPRELAVQFPHVVNRIAVLWHDDRATLENLRSLMVDDRGDRRGFPMEVAAEIASLHDWREQHRRR